MRRFFFAALVAALVSPVAAARQQPPADIPPPLAQGDHGVIIGTTGPLAVDAGFEILRRGGSAADAALATALFQAVECGGCYVSHAGILSLVYYEADTGQVHYLNACFNVPREEDPRSIPARGTPSGRTALVPGFMAGVEAAHERFGKLPREEIFAPAIAAAEDGIPVSPLLARFIAARQTVLSRLPETKRIFTDEDGRFYVEGDLFRQPEMALTLREVARQGASYMYTGQWAEDFVAAVQREGGKITADDMKAYRVIWETPLRTSWRGHEVCAPGFSSLGGVTMIEAIHLIEAVNLAERGGSAMSPETVFWLMQISHCQILSFLPPEMLQRYDGLELTPQSRVEPKTAAEIVERIENGTWPFAVRPRQENERPPTSHSDGIVVVDQWGNMAALTHTINTSLWGDTGLFVGGISISDAAADQQDLMQRAGVGNRLPDPMCPIIVLAGNKPVLGGSAIGGGLHQKSLQILARVIEFGVDPQQAVEMPAFMLPDYTVTPQIPQVERDHFDAEVLDGVRALGQEVREIPSAEAGAVRGYWVGVHVEPGGLRRAVGTRQAPLPSVARGY